jgi:catechol O-methyltransferase
MNLRRRLPLLRWSGLANGHRRSQYHENGPVGDGREAAAAEYVLTHARRGDIDDVVACHCVDSWM